MKRGRLLTPLQELPQARAGFAVFNSPLSEAAALGFEYGYSVQAPERLVIWEAQYGDFANGAQVVIDQFLLSARAKWGQTPSLVLLLPHAHEGQGPDHSSARPERFLQLFAGMNLRLANCTTAAQYFHLLRRQAALLTTDPLPLIVLTPKSLLRHPHTASSLRELAEGRWFPVIDDPAAQARQERVEELLLCSGKVIVDLLAAREETDRPDLALARLEQIAPFPAEAVQALLRTYPRLTRVTWVQEEPENMGAWLWLQPQLARLCEGRAALRLVARPPSSSPAEGSSSRHAVTQRALIAAAFDRPPAGGTPGRASRRR